MLSNNLAKSTIPDSNNYTGKVINCFVDDLINMNYPIVQISDGKLRGTYLEDFNGDKFHAFLSIPYGKPPVGNLRFKAPQPVVPWDGVKDVTEQGNASIHNSWKTNEIEGSEDCLNLHVFTKKLPSEEQNIKPVLVWIHGGGFTTGSHDIEIYGPSYFMTKDIVLVSITYRLGLLGFLSLKDISLEVPGNTGLKDQVLALKWVRKNIKDFNGDPNNVTIFGESAGGASVEYLMLTPTAKNLFHKAIAMSGCTLNPWTRSNFFDPTDFGKFLGHPNLNDNDLLNLLSNMPAEELYGFQTKYEEQNFCQEFGFITPVIEKPNPTAFIDRHPMYIIQSEEYNKVPLIMGYCSDEGLIIDILNSMREGQGKPPLKDDPTLKYLLPSDTNFNDTENVKKMSEKIIEFYNKHYDSKATAKLSDGLFIMGILVSAINHTKFSKNPVYLYRFSFEGDLNLLKKLFHCTAPGACHGDELGYIFKTEMAPLEAMGSEEKKTMQRLITMWTNFARFGTPTPQGNDLNIDWKPIQGGKINFLDIGNDLVIGENPEADRLKFWEEIYKMNPETSKYLKNKL